MTGRRLLLLLLLLLPLAVGALDAEAVQVALADVDTDCCDNVRCGSVQCDGNRTLIASDPANCVCCERCSRHRNESCVPGLGHDTCDVGLTCYAIDETGNHGICEAERPIGDYPDSEVDYDGSETELEVDSETCEIERCEQILRCPPDSRLVLDQPRRPVERSERDASNSAQDVAECCLRRFAPKCLCDYRQCPTAANPSVRHCLQERNVTVERHEGSTETESSSCCAQVERCAGVSASNASVNAVSNRRKLQEACGVWFNRSGHADVIDKGAAIMEQCSNSSYSGNCVHGSLELSLVANEAASRCCTELHCSSQSGVVCEAARCPHELGFVSALLTDLEVCVCVRKRPHSAYQPSLLICPQRLCAADNRPSKCFQHTHILDQAGCPICVSNDLPCNHSDLTVPKSCDDFRTGRHYLAGERWFSEHCGNCRCLQDGITRCDANNCAQSNREWVSVNLTLVLACTALAISLLVLIYIVARKLCSRKWKAKQNAARNQLMKTNINGSLSGEYQGGAVSWRMLNGHIARSSTNGYNMIERHRFPADGTVWQQATDLSADDFVYVALNGNAESFQKANAASHTATTTLESSNSNANSSTIV